MNRIERISAILVQLQSRQIVTARQIADSFHISLRTVYRDMRVLEEIGIPIIGDAGIGYSLTDGYKLPPLMFSQEEVLAFLTAEKMIEKTTDLQNSQSFRSGMNKIRALLKYLEKEDIANAEQNIDILGKHTETTKLPFAIIQHILQSVNRRKQLQINYLSPDKTLSTRNLEPVGCFHNQTDWYLIAFCNLRGQYRNFKIDRIANYKLLDTPFTKEHPTLSEYVKLHRKGNDTSEVIISLKNSDMQLFNSYKSYYGWLKEEVSHEYTTIHFRIFNLDHFARWYLSFADIASIIQPEELKDKVQILIESLAKRK